MSDGYVVGDETRFEFGRNWQRFLGVLNDERIAEAERSLQQRLGREDLSGVTFLDAGSGSGLFSLAARRLGATVRSFDYDLDAVRCGAELRRRYFPEDPHWVITQGDVLDRSWLQALGSFDVVYSWGVLHHTGAMWRALENIGTVVNPDGLLFISIYNDQGRTSERWRWVKRRYNELPRWARFSMIAPAFVRFWGITIAYDLTHGKGLATWRNYSENRGMSAWHDLIDWLGGYPFEVARPDEVFDFFRGRGFELTQLKTCGGALGCNEFVFRRGGPDTP